MSNGKYTIGRGTKVRVALMNECDRIIPEKPVFTVTTAADEGDTTLSVSVAPATTRPIVGPTYLNFIEANGKSHLVKVSGDIPAGATATLTVEALKQDLPLNAIAVFPVLLGNRTSASLNDADSQQDVMTFDNNGWRDQVTTMLGNGLELPGYYSPLDAGWNTCFFARLNFREVFWELELPKPGCESTGYTKGHIVRGFGGVQMPLEVPSDNIINANITITSRGPVTFIDPA